MAQLFSMHPQVFLQPHIAQRLKVVQANEKANLTRATPLNETNTFFIETSLSVMDLFKKIKFILTTLNYKDDLYIKYEPKNSPLFF